MKWLLIAVATVLACELLRLLPFRKRLGEISGFSAKAAQTLKSSQISDHWKERVLPAFALRIGIACIAILAMLILIVLPFLAASVFYPFGISGLTLDLLNPWVILGLIGFSVVYIRIRANRAWGAGGDYSATDRFLHRMALGVPVLPEMLHDLERVIFLKSSPDAADGAHVFVCGLARAGTTVLTRELYRTGAFGSLTYRDMPFILAPNAWQNLSRSSKLDAKSRAHGDGIQVDLDSPEALEEVFWRVTCGEDYIHETGLSRHSPDAEELTAYEEFLRLVLRRTGKPRYLSKNNNNILRLPALAGQFPKAQILVPIRDPFQHAQSLLTQHLRFKSASGFEANYFKWLGHHEFGATHRPFQLGEANEWDDGSTNYWLQAWINAYVHLNAAIAKTDGRIRFISFERLCRDEGYRNSIWSELNLGKSEFSEMRVIPKKEVDGLDPVLSATAVELYDKISGDTGWAA